MPPDLTPQQLLQMQGDCGPSTAFLQLIHLSKSYREGLNTHVVLKDACMNLEQGTVAAILGKSGSGKTTLLNLISGIDLADAGSVTLDGVNLTALNDHKRTLIRRKRIGFIFQFFNLIPTLTVWENVTLPLELNNLLQNGGSQNAEALLDEVGLLDRRKAYPEQLSGGEQQRVSIARALVHDPDLLLADEPTGNLDEETGRDILSLLDRLTRQRGKSLLLVTHSQEAAAIADRTIYLLDGHLMEYANGTHPGL
jgi:putative ABC transport system ATP-binding protein